MAWLIILAALILAGGIVYAVRKQKMKWKVIDEEKEMTDDLSKKYNLLLDNEIRCKLIEVASKEPSIGAAMHAGGMQSIQLSVHIEDYDRAMELLQQFPSHLSYSPTSKNFTSI